MTILLSKVAGTHVANILNVSRLDSSRIQSIFVQR